MERKSGERSIEESVPESESKEAGILLDSRKQAFFEKNSDFFLNDSILGEMQSSIETGWGDLDEENKKKILEMVEAFMQNLDEYHDSYVNLKWSADERRKLQLDDIAKYQAAVKNADEREHILHNTFMDSANILSRKMKQMGLSNDWRGNSMIYDMSSPRAMRDKMRDWMFRIYGEESRKKS